VDDHLELGAGGRAGGLERLEHLALGGRGQHVQRVGDEHNHDVRELRARRESNHHYW
jgi:hypothetical protein